MQQRIGKPSEIFQKIPSNSINETLMAASEPVSHWSWNGVTQHADTQDDGGRSVEDVHIVPGWTHVC